MAGGEEGRGEILSPTLPFPTSNKPASSNLNLIAQHHY